MRRALLRKEIHFAGPAAGAPGPRSRRADRGQRLAGARRAAPGAVTSLSQFGRRLTPISALVNAGAVQKSVGKVGKVEKVEIGCSRSPSTGTRCPCVSGAVFLIGAWNPVRSPIRVSWLGLYPRPQVLGVRRNTSADLVNKRWHQLCKRWHPDRNTEDTTATFQLLQDAKQRIDGV